MTEEDKLKKVEEYKITHDATIIGPKRWSERAQVCDVCESERKMCRANNLIYKIGDTYKKFGTPFLDNPKGVDTYRISSALCVCNECFPLFFPPFKVKKILITSGGTREYIDGVRVLTNISSGKLGALVADQFGSINNNIQRIPTPQFEIYFVYVKGSELPKIYSKYTHLIEVTDVESVYKVMEDLVPKMDVVIHPMAVSDFGFRPIHTKLKSNDLEAFIESLKERIYQTPKILFHIKEWNPNCFLISFKFEDGMTREELFESAIHSMEKNGSDIVVANDKSEMKELGIHKAYFLKKHLSVWTNEINPKMKEVSGKEEIAKVIFKIVNEI